MKYAEMLFPLSSLVHCPTVRIRARTTNHCRVFFLKAYHFQYITSLHGYTLEKGHDKHKPAQLRNHPSCYDHVPVMHTDTAQRPPFPPFSTQ
jgi:hypothetical protein